MGAQYFLHGDRAETSSNHFYCKKCDLFVPEDHFDDEAHQLQKDQLIRRGLDFLALSDTATRPDNWFNLFDRSVLNIKLNLKREIKGKSRRASLSDSVRFSVLKSDNYRCRICGKGADDGVKLHVDHKTPVSKGGTNDHENLWTLCERCNLGKSDRDL